MAYRWVTISIFILKKIEGKDKVVVNKENIIVDAKRDRIMDFLTYSNLPHYKYREICTKKQIEVADIDNEKILSFFDRGEVKTSYFTNLYKTERKLIEDISNYGMGVIINTRDNFNNMNLLPYILYQEIDPYYEKFPNTMFFKYIEKLKGTNKNNIKKLIKKKK